ncbi:MAG: cysteine-rich small domain-containing protein [Oscillospiraceae bacterium]
MPENSNCRKGRQSAFFCHRSCEAFPCHSGIAPEDFNCLFCYCPLYALGEKCGGDFVYTPQNSKDCSKCTFPHRRENYEAILKRFPELAQLAAKSAPEP